jgi:septum formation protein
MMPASWSIILGSSSKTRQAILRELGYDFDVLTADIDESAIRRESAEDLVLALAEAKAEAILGKLANAQQHSDESSSRNLQTLVLLITADQVVLHQGLILEKPRDAQQAREFIRGYSRAPASTVGAMVVKNLTTGVSVSGVDKTEVYFHPIPEEVVEALVAEGEVFYAAGGLLVEHPLVSPLVEAMVGSIDSVMGLPKDLTISLIAKALASKP